MRAYRQFLIVMIIVVMLVALVGRLFFLQSSATIEAWLSARGMEGTRGLVSKSVAQRRTATVLDDGRGRIVDRMGLPLAGGWPSLELNTQAYENRGKGVDDAAVQRYPVRPIAAHLIGYVAQYPELLEKLYERELLQGRIQVSDQVGAAGLERTFDRFLRPVNPIRKVSYRDGQFKPMSGMEDRIVRTDNEFYPLQLRTTIDRKLQMKIEQLLAQSDVEEAVIVVLAADNGDILAMAGKPTYDPYHVEPDLGMWNNKAVSAYSPGSVFKTVVAAAALEEGMTYPGERFQCDGVWHNHHLRCSNRSGHGQITLEQAYALSCNITFAKLAARLGPMKLEKTAEKLGIGRKVGWSKDRLETPVGVIEHFNQLDSEQPGQVFDPASNRMDEGVLARTGIGQQDVRMSPLQAARLTAIIANGGYEVKPRAVSEIRMNNNRTFLSFPAYERKERVLSGRTASWLANAMRLTVRSGTGKSLAYLSKIGGVGGKTGTAELDTVFPGGGGDDRAGRSTRVVHQWFTGFTPSAAPKYTFAVLAGNRQPNSPHMATKIAQELVLLLGDL
jgi:penicillin-binding protein 4B